MATVADQKQFIKGYIQARGAVDVTDSAFHFAYWQEFGGRRKLTNFGAEPVFKAMRLLGDMWRSGELTRRRIPLGDSGSGFPNWVYVYGLD